MEINIRNKQPVPGIYNVKQYSSGTDEFRFFIPRADVILSDISGAEARVKTNNFTVTAAVIASDEELTVIWVPKSDETAEAGSFEIQIEIIKDDYMWESYKAVYIVSASIDPIPPAPPGPEPTPELIPWTLLYNWLYPYWIREYPNASDTAKRQFVLNIKAFGEGEIESYEGPLTLFKMESGSVNPGATAIIGMAVGTVDEGDIITSSDTGIYVWNNSGGYGQATRIAGWTYSVGRIYDTLKW